MDNCYKPISGLNAKEEEEICTYIHCYGLLYITINNYTQ